MNRVCRSLLNIHLIDGSVEQLQMDHRFARGAEQLSFGRNNGDHQVFCPLILDKHIPQGIVFQIHLIHIKHHVFHMLIECPLFQANAEGGCRKLQGQLL